MSRNQFRVNRNQEWFETPKWHLVPVPILEFKGSVPHVQKEHPNLVTQADLIL